MMVERTPGFTVLGYATLGFAILVTAFPMAFAIITATHSLETVASGRIPVVPGPELLQNVQDAWRMGDLGNRALNTTIATLGIVLGKLALSTSTAFALVYFRLRFRKIIFWMIFCTLMLPIEVRIVTTYQVAANVLSPLQSLLDALGISGFLENRLGLRVDLNWSMLNSYVGLTVPVLASATGTFLFRQFFMTVPPELAEAAQIDGAGPIRFFLRVLLPLSRTNLAALATIMFVYGWNQYLWPLLITTQRQMATLAMSLVSISPQFDDPPFWNITMAGVVLALVPPVVVVLAMQRYFVKGLVGSSR